MVDAFLQAGWRVKGTVRNKSKADHIRSRYPSHADQLDLVEVKDIVSGDGLKEAMQGVDAVAHTASPCEETPPGSRAVFQFARLTLHIWNRRVDLHGPDQRLYRPRRQGNSDRPSSGQGASLSSRLRR